MSARAEVPGTRSVSDQNLLAAGGEMGALMRSLDWSRTPLGPTESWSLALRMMVRFLLANRFPLLLWWGPEFCQLYNDPYRPVLGTKHPQSMGQPARDCWPEIWHVIGPLIERPFQGGEPTWMEDIFLEINRHGYVEETHFTIAYSPVPDETAPTGIGGVLATVHEITGKVIGERRIVLLRDLGTRSAEAKTAEEACSLAADTLARNPKDVPFAIVYLLDRDEKTARLASACGVAAGEVLSPLSIDLSPDALAEQQVWPFAEAVRHESMQIVRNLSQRFGMAPHGPWSDPPESAVVLPLRANVAHQLAGLVVLGVSSRLEFDERYASFFELVASQVSTAIANAVAYEAERRRAEALAALDSAKTAFFSNVSHEFRTPLTLLLGPLEDMLASADDRQREQLAVAHRNALRLLRLVNSLLDFSRIEAGRTQAAYQPIDLAGVTAELASVFRSAIEKAGLRLVLDCPPLPEPIYIDPDMWEKIALNLLSNAFKFTFEGEIAVRVRTADDRAEVMISDTGIGIPADQIPHIFERFHRIEGSRGRTHEGTGIGLALVQELVKLHAGSIRVDSAAGVGTTFTVSLPFGTSHLPQLRIQESSRRGVNDSQRQAFVEEATLWLPDGGGSTASPRSGHAVARPTARLLIADDNADMREYVRRLLSDQYDVITAANGREALEAALASQPDLVLSDVMMPVLDGFGLLKALRSNPATVGIPVILLSARAGEEARTEGMDSGADDYLVKPFSARELLARVAAHLRLAQARKEAEGRASLILESIKDGFVALDREGRFTYVNAEAERINTFTREQHLGKNVWEMFPMVVGTLLEEKVRQAASQRARVDFEYHDPVTQHWFMGTIYPTRDGGLSIFFRDITEQKRAAEALRESERRFRSMTEALPQLVWTCLPNGDCDYLSAQWVAYTGVTEEEQLGLRWLDLVLHPDDRARTYEAWMNAVASLAPYDLEYRLRRYDGTYRWFKTRGTPLRDERGQILRWFGTCTDIDDQMRIENELRRANQDLEQFAFSASHDLQEPLRMVSIYSQMLQRRYGNRLDPQADEFIGFVTRGARQMEVLLKDLLAYTQAAAGDDSAPIESLSMQSVMEAVEESLKPAIEESGAVIIAEDLPAVRVKRVHLTQLFQNLVGNAIKYRSEKTPEIYVSAQRKGMDWLVSVRDNGIGINPKYKDLVFGVFKRLHGQKYEGTGIGLAICQRIVERYGGRIWVESQLGMGSTFYFTLPA